MLWEGEVGQEKNVIWCTQQSMVIEHWLKVKKKKKTLETNPLRGPKHLLLPALLTGGLSFLLAVLWSASSLRTVL